jgi:hypothetical protein
MTAALALAQRRRAVSAVSPLWLMTKTSESFGSGMLR